MLTRHYTLRLATPAFIGNASQSGQWRTPPVKALLRQWWRVAYAAGQAGALSDSVMRKAEGQLFGMAADDGDGRSCKSLVRIRLSHWNLGELKDWNGLERQRLAHPEVTAPVGAQLYLGYGPLVFAHGQTALKDQAALQAQEQASLKIAFPSGDQAARLQQALWLMQHYGTLGGRSRNGWGSFSLTPADTTTPALDGPPERGFCLPWRQALEADWPRAIGSDGHGPLIWQTQAMVDWPAVMRRLAEVKIGLRTQFLFATGKDAAQPEARHWLSYPIGTNHTVRDWGKVRLLNSRLPSSLRFKVRADPDGRLRGFIFHVPCRPPPSFNPNTAALVDVWKRVHSLLDELTQPMASRSYNSIADSARKAALRPMLDAVSLSRSDR